MFSLLLWLSIPSFTFSFHFLCLSLLYFALCPKVTTDNFYCGISFPLFSLALVLISTRMILLLDSYNNTTIPLFHLVAPDFLKVLSQLIMLSLNSCQLSVCTLSLYWQSGIESFGIENGANSVKSAYCIRLEFVYFYLNTILETDFALVFFYFYAYFTTTVMMAMNYLALLIINLKLYSYRCIFIGHVWKKYKLKILLLVVLIIFLNWAIVSNLMVHIKR